MEQDPPRRFYFKHFKAISHALSTYEDLNLLFTHLTEGTSRTFEAKGCTIMLFDDRENQLFPVSSYGISEEYLNKGPIIVDDKYSAFFTGHPIYIENVQDDVRVQYPNDAVVEGIVSILSVPIKMRGTPLGLIRIYHSECKKFHEKDIDAMKVMAEHLGLAIEYSGLKNFLDQVRLSLESLPLRMLK